MVFQFLKLAQKTPEEEFKEQAKQELESKKAQKGPTEEKAENFQEFMKSPEVARLVSEWKKKGFTKRGITKLLSILFPMFNSNKSVLASAKDLLASLKGEDGLSRVLSVLKLVPEGIMKGMK